MDPSIMNTTDNTHSRASTRFSSVLRLAVTALAALALGLSAVAPQDTLAQDFYDVNSVQDKSDNNQGDGDCDTGGTLSDGDAECTLRAAIEESNADADADNIDFASDLPTTNGFATISVTSELVIDREVEIDGTTAPGYPSQQADGPIVKIDGSQTSGSSVDGLDIKERPNEKPAGTIIRALAITNFPDEGINTTDDDITIEECFIGLDVDGETIEGNNQNPDTGTFPRHGGIVITGSQSLVTNNVISGNERAGIVVGSADGSVDANLTNENAIEDNIVGLAASDSSTAKGNGESGIRIEDGTNNTIGGFTSLGQFLDSSDGNTVSANDGVGIVVESDGNLLRNNFVGTTYDGSSERGNENGVVLLGDNNTVDAAGFSLTTVISGNTFNGIRLGVGGGDAADNNTIEGNFIGVTANTSSALPNGDGCIEGGVRVDNGSDNTITSNVISGNNARGIFVRGSNSLSNTITDNLIGTNGSFDALSNNCDGIQVNTDAGSFIDGNEIHDGNVIAFNDGNGVDISGSYGKVTNNFIGTNANGDDLGNNLDGVNVSASEVLVGRSSSLGEDGNIIGHNGNDGIDLSGASNAFVYANYIGTNANDADLGNGDIGIEVQEANNNAAADNEVGYASSDTFSDPLPSDGGNGNVVAYNGSKGIAVEGTPSTGNPIRGNSVYQNGGADDSDIGIDLGNDGSGAGNDNGDGDDGPNRLQNHPVNFDVTNCDDSSPTTTVDITFTVRSNAGGGSASKYPLQVDFYVADSEISGEGKTYLQTEEYPSGNANSPYAFTLSTDEATCDDYFVATATDDRGNTSEFFGPPGQQLPVELASFDASQSGESAVELRWTTASETNNAGFRVQHRASGEESWTRLGYVASKASGGTTTEAKTYRFDAEDLAVGTHEFRLKQMDLDGTAHLHDPVDVELQMQQALRLKAPAPNPVQGQAQLSFAVRDQTETTITMYNPLGQKVAVVYRGTPPAGEQQTAQVTTDDLASGVYFLRLQAGGATKTQKMTVVR